MALRIYLASRYSRREELNGYANELRAAGHDVTSRWLDGSHQISDGGTPIGDDGESLVEGYRDSPEAAELRLKFAEDDLWDINMSDLLIAFTEPPRSSASRGGRHVEFGYALARRLPILVIGPRENLFCWLPQVQHASTWDEAKTKYGWLQKAA